MLGRAHLERLHHAIFLWTHGGIRLEERIGVDFANARRLVDVKGRVVESDSPRKLAVTWNIDWIEELKKLPEAMVAFEIEPMGEVVRLTMTESHDANSGLYAGRGRRGWPVILCGLKSLLETGRAPKIPKP